MAFAAARIFDLCSGHNGFGQHQIVQGSPTVFVNGRSVARQADQCSVHCNNRSCHVGSIASGSSTVMANGLPQGRVTDPISCGGRIISGSPDIFIA